MHYLWWRLSCPLSLFWLRVCQEKGTLRNMIPRYDFPSFVWPGKLYLRIIFLRYWNWKSGKPPQTKIPVFCSVPRSTSTRTKNIWWINFLMAVIVLTFLKVVLNVLSNWGKYFEHKRSKQYWAQSFNKAGFFFVQIDRGNKQKLAFGIVINIPSTIVFPRKCDS